VDTPEDRFDTIGTGIAMQLVEASISTLRWMRMQCTRKVERLKKIKRLSTKSIPGIGLMRRNSRITNLGLVHFS